MAASSTRTMMQQDLDRHAVPAAGPGDPVKDVASPDPPFRAITIVDLDRTITRRGTYSPFLLFAAAKMRPHRLVLAPVAIAAMLVYRLGLLSRDDLKETMHHLLLGSWIDSAALDRVAASYADHTLRTNLNRDAVDLIRREQDEGRLVILATAAHRFYAEPFARRLGIEAVVATDSRSSNGRLSYQLAGRNCHGSAKASAVAAKLRVLGIDRAAARLRCYSDDHADLPCFEACDEPVAVNPTAALASHARAHGWRILTLR